MSTRNIEIQDSNGNVYYPHTDSSVVKYGDSDVGSALANIANKEDLNTAEITNIKTDYAKKIDVNVLASNKADNATVTTLSTKVDSLASGAPKAVSLVNQMIDITKNYVYVGSESGYISGNWYYYNGTAWTSGGVYQSTGIADYSITEEKINGLDVKMQDLNNSVKSNYNIINVNEIDFDIFSETTPTCDNGNITMATTSTKDYTHLFFSENIKEIEFDYNDDTNCKFVILGGTDNLQTVIGLGSNVQRMVQDMHFTVDNSSTVIRNPIGLDYINVGDTVKIIVKDSNTYNIYVKRSGTTEFVLWTTINKTDCPTAQGWLSNSKLGFPRYKGLTSTSIMYKNAKKKVFIDETPKFHNWNVVGDSITMFRQYQGYVQNILGIEKINNYGVGGSCITYAANEPYPSVTTRISSIDNTADIITIFAGTNDYGNPPYMPLGTILDTVNTTFYGAYNYIIQNCISRNPNAKIAIFTPLQRVSGEDKNTQNLILEDYANACIEIGKKYAIPVLDLFHTSNINKYNASTLLKDGLHPTTAGYIRIAKQVASFLKAI
jgi:lysophospholipase L1-like esterase